MVRPNMEQIVLNNGVLLEGSTLTVRTAGRKVYLLGGGNLVNLSCAEGHPSEVLTPGLSGGV